ncbi:2-aminoethylphosphonate--pyruvate transaminase, partial [Vibrio echinoideorum]
HTVRAFYQALLELEQEGCIEASHNRYQTNQTTLVTGMSSLGFEPLLNHDLHSPIITSFYSTTHSDYQFKEIYDR